MLSYIVRHTALAALVAVVCAGCSEDQLNEQYARYTITAEPTAKQVALANPVGIDYQMVPLGAPITATFRIENISPTTLEIQAVNVAAATNGDLDPAILEIKNGTYDTDTNRVIGGTRARATLPLDLNTAGSAENTAYLVVTLTPTSSRALQKGETVEIDATIDIRTNAGQTHDEVIRVQLVGEGEFIGEGNLELVYNSQVFSLPADCQASSPAGKCVLDTLDFGNVSLSSSASTSLVLRNIPKAGDCQLPNLSDNPPVPDCTPACAVTFAANPQNANLGLGFLPNNTGFGIAGSASVPFMVAPFKAGCDSVGRTVRGDLELVLNFQSSPTAGPAASTLILESNDPGAPIIEIPLRATSLEAPVAVAAIRLCDGTGDPCSDPAALEPLRRVFFEGKDSYDQGTATIDDYRWEVVQFPDGASPIACDFTLPGSNPANDDCVYSPNPSTNPARPDLFDMNIPLAGTYVVRLHVTNSAGVVSGISSTSDVEFEALPSSLLHLQLIWDHLSNDQDLHLVHVDAAGNGLVYHGDQDCFWGNCRPSCGVPLLDPDCTPVQWFAADAPFTVGNPRLDRDDTHGLGPENINIDRPKAGRYRLYVHYYGLTDSSTDLTGVTVRVFIDGLLRQEYRNTLQRNDLWAVAELIWAADDSAQVRSPDPSVDAVQQLIYLPPANEGYVWIGPTPF